MITLRPKLLEQGIGWGLIVLVVVMPFHAFLSVWLGSLVGHQSLIQAWKEVLTILLVIATSVLIYLEPQRLQALKRPIFYSLIGFVGVALAVTLFTPHTGNSAIFGIKTDLEYLALFVVAYLVATRELKYRLVKLIIITSVVVSFFGIVLAFILPPDFLVHFGYGPTTIQPYLNLDPALNAIRTPSTLGGPNQLGAFLIIALCLSLGLALRRFRWWQPLAFAILVGGIYVSYSRSAWIGAIVGLVVTLIVSLPRKRAIIASASIAIFAVLAGSLVVSQLDTNTKLQSYVLHKLPTQGDNVNSTFLHGQALSDGFAIIMAQPLGQGLGSAGPASFHGSTSFIPENFYIQIAIETGVVGLVLFVTFQALVAIELFRRRHEIGIAAGLLGALVGISVVNLVLHGWADSSLAFVFWILAGATLGEARRRV